MHALKYVTSSSALLLFFGCSGSELGDGAGGTDGAADGGSVGDGDLGTGGDGASDGGGLGTGGDAASGGAASGGGATTGAGGDAASGGVLGTGGFSVGGDGSGGDLTTTGGAGSGGDAGSGGSTTSLPSGTFLMDGDGYVIFEAEDIDAGDLPGNWVVLQDAGPCDEGGCTPSSGAYIQYQADSLGDCSNHGGPQAASTTTVSFEVRTSGYHRLVWRNLRDHRAGACEHDKNNDSFVAFPGAMNDEHFQEPFKVYGGGSGSFTWSGSYDIHDLGKDDVCVDLDAGVQTFDLAGRSNWHAIDRIAIVYTGDDLQSCRGNGPKEGLDARPNTGVAP